MNELRHRIQALLNSHHVMSLATLGPEGPHAANVFYAFDGFALIWISDPSSRHSRHVEADSRVAATIAQDYSDFSNVRGLQIYGLAHRTPENERGQNLMLLESRYPFLRLAGDGPREIRDAYLKSALYRLDPKRITLIDNTMGFANKNTLELD